MKGKSNTAETVYKQILEPEYIRKKSLNLAVNSIKLLENYEKYKKLKKRKMFLLDELKKVMYILKEEVKILDSKVPSPKGIEQKEKMTERAMERVQRENNQKQNGKIIENEEEKILINLNRELNQIKSKLNTLKF